jgi:hypothetical protein
MLIKVPLVNKSSGIFSSVKSNPPDFLSNTLTISLNYVY